MKKKNNGYTFMFFPEGGGNPFTLQIHPYTFYLTIISVVLIISGLVLLLYKTGEIGLKLQLVQGLKEENARLTQHNNDLRISADKIASIDSLTAYLHRLSAISGTGAVGGLAYAEINKLPQPVLSAQATAKNIPEAPSVIQAEEVARESVGVQKSVTTAGNYTASVPNIMPVDGWITRRFVTDTEEGAHLGLDVAAAGGTPIRATAMGVVDDIRNDKYFGLVVEVRHENGFVTRYAHCSQILVSVSDRVNRGQTIALVGSTGRSTAPHLHYEVLALGKSIDPIEYIGTQKP